MDNPETAGKIKSRINKLAIFAEEKDEESLRFQN